MHTKIYSLDKLKWISLVPILPVLNPSNNSTHLTHIVFFWIQTLTQVRQQLWPVTKLSLGNNGGDQDAYGGSDQRRLISNIVEAFLLDEIGHLWWELLKVSSHIVLQNEATKGTGRIIWNKQTLRIQIFHSSQTKLVLTTSLWIINNLMSSSASFCMDTLKINLKNLSITSLCTFFKATLLPLPPLLQKANKNIIIL